MLFADDLVICDKTREQTEEQLELWIHEIDYKGPRVIRGKTDYQPQPSCQRSYKLNLVEKISKP